MPHIEHLSEKAQILLDEIIQYVRKIRDENRSSACDLYKLQSFNLEVNSAESWALGMQVKKGVGEAATKLEDAGMEKIACLQRKVVEV